MKISASEKQAAVGFIRDYGAKTARQVTNRLQRTKRTGIGIPEVRRFLNGISGEGKRLLKKKSGRNWVYYLNPSYTPPPPQS
ncbi:hypothetical protein HN803_00605 [candidate division WWE3 bacterium]|nr:hypothetical protein [candidate division WWE3 bacterium]MBT7349281.1 hypothetical protein [candidate division WWE3 bacterium]